MLELNGCCFADIFKSILFKENICILIEVSLNINTKASIDNKPAFV